MILKILHIFFIVLSLSLSSAYAKPERCVAAYDFGLGGAFLISANPDEGNSGASRLVQSKPYRDQIAAWTPTYLSTTGVAQSGSSSYGDGKLKVYINGKWGPWGGDVESMANNCQLRECDPSKAGDSVCLSGGMIVDMKQDGSNIPCKLENGIGLYGLVALDINGQRFDPNDPAYARALPNKYFRTFRMWPLQEDADGKYFELNFTQQCDSSDTGSTVCIGDKNADGQGVVAKGSLYFKILDRYYQDNTGGYDINIVSGVVSEKGFIETVIEEFTKIMMNVAQKMYIALTSDLGFITAVKALLVMYVTMTGVMFMMGMLNINQGELLVRVFKIAIITILISDTSWDFFNKYLFSLFTEGAASIGAIVTKATFGYSNDYGFMHFILTDTSSPLSVFDSIFNVIKNPAIHYKIVSLLLFNYYYFLYIVFIYLCIYILILAIIRAVVMYITAVLFIALMLIIAPIFLSFMLFKFTKELFDGWLKQLLANAMMVVIVSTTLALMANLILNQLYQLLYFKACWDIVWSLNIAGIHFFDVWFWTPSDPEQLNKCLTPEHLFSFLLVCILFNTFMEEIPQLIDSLSGAFLQPISSAYGAVYHGIQNTWGYRLGSDIFNVIRSPLSMTEFNTKAVSRMHSRIDGYERRFFQQLSGGEKQNTEILSFARDWFGDYKEAARDAVPDAFATQEELDRREKKKQQRIQSGDE